MLVCNVLHVVHDYNSLLIQKTKVIYGELAMGVQQSLHSAEQPVVSLTLPVWAGRLHRKGLGSSKVAAYRYQMRK